MASGEDIIKYATQKIVEYIETPSKQRKEQRMTRRHTREHWVTRWFGMIPMSIFMVWGKSRRRKAKEAKKAP